MGFRLDAFIIGVIIFSFIIAVGSGMIVNMADNYGVEYDDEFGTTYIIIQDMYNDTVTQKEDVFGGEIEEEDALDSAIKGGTSALKIIDKPTKNNKFDSWGYSRKDSTSNWHQIIFHDCFDSHGYIWSNIFVFSG